MTQTKQDCSTPDQLLTFLRGQLSAREEADLQHHLDDCVSCRERLESTAADVSVWKEAREFFASGALQNSSKDSSEDHEETNQVQYRIRQVLDSLGPTDDPESLGRIGGYEVTGVVGAGGMGVVLKAHDRSLDRIVAIKVMSPHLSSSGSARKRFAREAKAAAAVLHPNVIAIHSVASEDANPYLVMPFVRGTSLQKRIDSQGPLPLKDTLRIGAQIAAGLAAAHEQGLVHRDIKPANILLEEGVERVTITDFGLARAVDDASMTCSGVIAGTPQYMSPEQARGEPIDARSDLFSLGGVLYAMCTGRSPFRAETTYGVLHRIANDNPTPVCEVNTDVPVWLGHLIERLMAKRPEDRFESAAQVAELLEGCLAHVQQPAAMPLPETVTALAPIKTRRPPIGKLIVAAAFALAFIFAGVFVVLELNKGTLTIQSDVDDIRVRITRGEDVVNELKVTTSGQSVRLTAGQYEVELIGETDGLTIQNGQVTLQRADTEVVRIFHNAHDTNLPTHAAPIASQPAKQQTDQVIDALVTFEFSGVSGNATLNTFGIGWVVDQRGHILVPSEMAPRSEDYSIEVRFADGSRTSAKRVFTFGHLALLKPEKAPAIAPIKLNSKQAVQDGDQVLAILNGTDVQKGTVTSAKKTIVSLDSWPILYSPRLRFPNAIETDFKSDPATLFGAPLLTPSGEVVGMLLNYKPPMFAIPLSEIQVACREFEASHIQAAVNSAEATIAAEEAVAEHSEILPATIDDERASNAVKRVMQYLTAVKEKDSETINSIAKGLRKHEKREKDMATLLIDGGIPKFYKTWFVNHSAVVALGPLSTSDKQMNGRFLLFTLSLVDEQWSIVDVDLEVEERLLERFKNPIQAAEGTPETANSKSNADEKNSSKSSIIVDVYGGNRVLGQNNAKYGKMVQALDAIDDVQVNFREAGPGSDIVLAIVRDRNGLMNQEANSTGKPSARRDAITKALGQVPTVRWEEGVLGVSLERNQPPVVGEQAETVNSAATADEAYQAMEKLLVNAKMDWKSTERYIAIAATRMTSNIEFAKYVLDRFRIACEGGESNYQARRHLLAVLTKAFHAWGQNRWSTDPASIEQHAKPSKTWPQEIRDFELSALESVVSYGYKATRSDIVDFVRAARALHHPDAKPFLQAVLLNPQSLNSSPFATPAQAATPPNQSTWSDNVGGSWPDARFVAAVGLAELGDPSAIDWLLDKAQPKDFGFESIYQERHERDRSDSLRESSRYALIDLFGHPKDLTATQLSDWWKLNRAVVTRRMVRLKSDFATKIETLQERILANARIVVEAYVASAISGHVAQASDLAKNSPADPKRIQELPEFLNVQRLKIETVYINDPAKPTQALATSEAVKLDEKHKIPDGRRDGFMVFTLELTDERWFVIDIDFETESGAEKELKEFLKANPNSIGIPPQSESLSR